MLILLNYQLTMSTGKKLFLILILIRKFLFLTKRSTMFSIMIFYREQNRPLSILFVILNIFKKLLCKQLTMFTDQNLSKHQCDFRKGFSTQYSLVAMLENRKGAVDDKKVFGALLIELSKAFGCLCHKLIMDGGARGSRGTSAPLLFFSKISLYHFFNFF